MRQEKIRKNYSKLPLIAYVTIIVVATIIMTYLIYPFKEISIKNTKIWNDNGTTYIKIGKIEWSLRFNKGNDLYETKTLKFSEINSTSISKEEFSKIFRRVSILSQSIINIKTERQLNSFSITIPTYLESEKVSKLVENQGLLSAMMETSSTSEENGGQKGENTYQDIGISNSDISTVTASLKQEPSLSTTTPIRMLTIKFKNPKDIGQKIPPELIGAVSFQIDHKNIGAILNVNGIPLGYALTTQGEWQIKSIDIIPIGAFSAEEAEALLKTGPLDGKYTKNEEFVNRPLVKSLLILIPLPILELVFLFISALILNRRIFIYFLLTLLPATTFTVLISKVVGVTLELATIIAVFLGITAMSYILVNTAVKVNQKIKNNISTTLAYRSALNDYSKKFSVFLNALVLMGITIMLFKVTSLMNISLMFLILALWFFVFISVLSPIVIAIFNARQGYAGKSPNKKRQ